MNKRNDLVCTYCLRRRVKRLLKRDTDCGEAGCEIQHWMCRSEINCNAAMERGKR